MTRFLFGPVGPGFADEYLVDVRAAGACRTFGRDGGDVRVEPGDTWAAVEGRLPPGWRPDFVAVWLPYTSPPPAVWDAPVPVLGLAGDWNLLWHAYRHLLPLCDAVLVDEPGVAVLHAAGVGHARPANLYGLGRSYLDGFDAPEGDRDIDVLFVGNLSPSVQRERAGWVPRLARLADRHRVVVRTGVYGAEYRRLLWRAKLAFNRSIRGECNQRAFEAPACGAVLLQEAGNAEVQRFLWPETEYVPYTDADLADRIARLLAADDARRRVAAAGQDRVRGYSFEALLRDGVSRVFRDPAGVAARAAARLGRRPSLTGRVWVALGAGAGNDPGLPAALVAAGRHEAALLPGRRDRDPDAPPLVAAARANRVAALTRAEFLREAGRPADAVAAARAVLADLDARTGLTAEELDTPPYPARYDVLRVEWERAGWAAGGQAGEEAAKRDLVRVRAHGLIADGTGSLGDARAAAALRPDLPTVRAAYGTALARAGRPSEALDHLRAAAAALPLAAATARAYHEALVALGETASAADFAADRRRLAAVAPDVIRTEAWFADLSQVAVDPAGEVVPGAGPLTKSVELTEPVRPMPAASRGPMRVALTMIVRDEEHNLPAGLGAVRGLFHDVVVVDTGSADRTAAVAAGLGARVVHVPWADSFAAARNAALDHARGDYAFWLDADDRVDGPNRSALAALFAGLRDEHAAYVVKCRCTSARPGGVTVVDHVRLFRIRPDVRWTYRVHEQILPALRRTGVVVRWAAAAVDHVGYADPALRRRKLGRDLRLLGLERAAAPGDPFVLFNLGSIYQELGRPDEALAALEASLRASHPRDSIVRKLYARIAGCHRAAGRPAAARAAVAEGRGHYPADAELLYLDGVLRRDGGDLAGAAEAFEALLAGRDGAYFASVDPNLRGSKARGQLAEVYREQGRAAEADALKARVFTGEPELLLPAAASSHESEHRRSNLTGQTWPVGDHEQ